MSGDMALTGRPRVPNKGWYLSIITVDVSLLVHSKKLFMRGTIQLINRYD